MSGALDGVERGRPVQQPGLVGVDTNTRPMWVIAFLPLLSVLIGRIPSRINGSGETAGTSGLALDALIVALTLGLLVVEALLARADQRTLAARGVLHPMRWGWAFLDPIYVIGRAVVVRRRVRGSLAPLWVWIITTAFTYVLNLTVR